MRSIAVISYTKQYAEALEENLKVFFKDKVIVNGYVVGEMAQKSDLEEDIIVLSTYAIFQILRDRLEKKENIFVVERTLYNKTIEELRRIPEGTKALIVNLDYKNAMELMALLNDAKLTNLEMHPYWPGEEYDKSITLAITPNERIHVPTTVKEIIDIGERPLSFQQIQRIAESAGVKDITETPESKAARDALFDSTGDDYSIREIRSMATKQDSVLSLIDRGIIITNNIGNMYYVNDIARKMLPTRDVSTDGISVFDAIPKIREAIKNGNWVDYETMVKLDGREVMCQVKVIREHGVADGVMVALEDLAEAENKKSKYKKRMRGAGHYARYTFDDIEGRSQSISECKDIARRIAKSDSNVYINGESGVGKELFAQSIHNASNRRGYAFVAINCSALPENLLESELYGYEEGAFTGASKGGKIGLFELADKGTLFLDEIAEIPKPLQAKLLRAIEERTILRIGGSDMIEVDVRIICATNKDLRQLIREDKFREDLYYRLCVLPLAVPPLRERYGDMELLFDKMKEGKGAEFVLNDSAKQLLREYSWPGNVRELKNVVEYLTSLDASVIGASDLPFYSEAQNNSLSNGSQEIAMPENGLYSANGMGNGFSQSMNGNGRGFNPASISETDVEKFILREMLACVRENRHVGRRQLAEVAREKGLFITEYQIKAALNRLNENGEIVSFKGRKGSIITDKGIDKINQL